MDHRTIQDLLREKGLRANEVKLSVFGVSDGALRAIHCDSFSEKLLGRVMPIKSERGPVGIAGRAVQTAKIQAVSDVRMDRDYIHVHETTRSTMAVPIKVAGKVVAVVSFDSPAISYFEGGESRFIELANYIAEYLHLSQREKREILLPETLLKTDILTGDVPVTIVELSDSLLYELAKAPELVHSLTSRKFEELIARLLSDKGYTVKLTPAQKDGGRDVLAYLDLPTGSLLTLVECKKWSPNRPVPIGVVRGAYGVLLHERASHVMIATTSRFTSPAQQFVTAIRYQMSLKDYEDITDWLHSYLQT